MVAVRTIETGSVPEDYFKPPRPTLEKYREAYGGSLEAWVDAIKGESCQCLRCGEMIENIGYGDSIILIQIRFPRNVVEKISALYQDLLGQDRNINGVSEKTASIALHDTHGNQASGLFTCGNCRHQHGHHREGEWWNVNGDMGETPIYNQVKYNLSRSTAD